MLNGIPRILVVRLSAIGDVVRVLPAVHCVRDAHPHAQIDWVVERKSAAIVEDHPDVDQVFVFERPSGAGSAIKEFLRLCRRIRKGRYDIVLDFHGIAKSGLIAAFSGAPQRYGFAAPRGRELSSLAANHRMKLGPEVENRLHENLALIRDIAPGTKKLDALISVPVDVQESVSEFFEENFDGAKWVVSMHVPVDRQEKQWPLEHFAELTDLLLADGRFEVLLTWGPGQRWMAEKVARVARRKPVISPELENLKALAWVLHSADLYFGGDTGPMHIASAMETPVVAVFGGTDPDKHAPLRRPYNVLTGSVPGTRGTVHERAQARLRSIDAETAYDACVSTVEGREINKAI